MDGQKKQLKPWPKSLHTTLLVWRLLITSEDIILCFPFSQFPTDIVQCA